jgi:hypothetical protein
MKSNIRSVDTFSGGWRDEDDDADVSE